MYRTEKNEDFPTVYTAKDTRSMVVKSLTLQNSEMYSLRLQAKRGTRSLKTTSVILTIVCTFVT